MGANAKTARALVPLVEGEVSSQLSPPGKQADGGELPCLECVVRALDGMDPLVQALKETALLSEMLAACHRRLP